MLDCPATDDFFRSPMNRQEIEAQVAQMFCRTQHPQLVIPAQA